MKGKTLSASTIDPSKRYIVGLGEALFDCFEDHTNLGGAPLNATLVAHSLTTGSKLAGQMVSRIGNDDFGKQVQQTLQTRGLNTNTIQIDDTAPTGRVHVEMVDGEPEYDIVKEVAWDYIQWDDLLADLAKLAAGVTFGTLAQRNSTSRETIWKFLSEATDAVRFFDVNLRQDFFSAEILKKSCQLASAIKLNKDELSVVTSHLNLDSSSPAKSLLETYNLKAVVLTHGKQGTELITPEGSWKAPVPTFPQEEGSDPVGAGDACGATCLVGLIQGWSPEKIVASANRVGAYVASRRGATPEINPTELLENI